MDRGLKIFTALLLVLLVLGIYIRSTTPPAINRSPTYHLNDKIPLGLYILNHEIETIFKDAEVILWPKSYYEYGMHLIPPDSIQGKKTYETEEDIEQDIPAQISGTTTRTTKDSTVTWYNGILHVSRFFDCDATSVRSLLNYVRDGNHALISATDYSEDFKKALKIRTVWPEKYANYENILINTGAGLPPVTGNWPYSGVYLDLDSLKTYSVLGYTCDKNDQWMPNCVRIKWGKGAIYLHTEPAIFSNYCLLKNDNYKQAEYLLNLINGEDIIWLVQGQWEEALSDSPLRFIKSQPPLRLAWYLILASFLLLMIFNAKRWQRAVPVLSPNTNTTVEFVRTISNLYQQEGSVRDIMDKKIIFFLERIRSRYRISTEVLDNSFILKLQAKTQCTPADAERLVFLIQKHRDTDYECTHDDLRRLNTAMEKVETGSRMMNQE